eukprot:1160514-Pelagomonas_calceolata.AAC.14
MQLGSLDPATHAYAAWEGFPVQAKIAVGDLFVATPSLHTITIVQRSLRNEVCVWGMGHVMWQQGGIMTFKGWDGVVDGASL